MARSLTITYGSLQVGATQSNGDIYLTDKYREFVSKDEAGCEFTVVISSSTAAGYVTAQAHMLGQLQVPDQAWSVALGGTRATFSPSTNTGFLTRAEARKVGGISDTAKSAEWVIRLVTQLPATYDSRAGRREASVEFQVDASERKLARFEGTWTAVTSPATSALAQYQAEIDTFCNSHLADYAAGDASGNWNLIEDRPRYDDQTKILRFVRVYELVSHEESQGGLNHASLALQNLTVLRRSFGDQRAAAYADVTSPFDFVTINYRANVKLSQTDADGLEALYEGTIRPHLLAQITDTLIISREDVTYDKANNIILASLSGRATKSGLIQSEVRVRVVRDAGKLLLPSYDGNPYSRWIYQGPASEFYEVSVNLVQVTPESFSSAVVIAPYETNPRLVRVGDSYGEARTVVGKAPGIELLATAEVYAYVRADKPQAGGADDLGADPIEADDTTTDRPQTGNGQVVRVDEALGLD